MLLHDIRGEHIEQVVVPAIGSATATTNIPIFWSPFDCKLHQVYFTLGSAITGDDSNTFNLNLINRGTDGSGTAEIDNVDFGSGTDGTAHVRTTLYSSSTGTSLDAGTHLTLQREKVGNGQNMPYMLVEIVYKGA